MLDELVGEKVVVDLLDGSTHLGFLRDRYEEDRSRFPHFNLPRNIYYIEYLLDNDRCTGSERFHANHVKTIEKWR